MISNPIDGTVYNEDGSHAYVKYKYQKAFSKKAFNFQPKDCGLSDTREANLLFFALNETHALARLKRMLEWYLANNQNDPRGINGSNEHSEYWKKHRQSKVKHWLDNWDKVKVVEVPLDQFFIVGWAGNDTML